jgi:hypothetical protein
MPAQQPPASVRPRPESLPSVATSRQSLCLHHARFPLAPSPGRSAAYPLAPAPQPRRDVSKSGIGHPQWSTSLHSPPAHRPRLDYSAAPVHPQHEPVKVYSCTARLAPGDSPRPSSCPHHPLPSPCPPPSPLPVAATTSSRMPSGAGVGPPLKSALNHRHRAAQRPRR